MNEYVVQINYRTNSGCNAKTLRIMADDGHAAIDAATAKVRRMRGVIRIDGGDCMPINGRDQYDL